MANIPSCLMVIQRGCTTATEDGLKKPLIGF